MPNNASPVAPSEQEPANNQPTDLTYGEWPTSTPGAASDPEAAINQRTDLTYGERPTNMDYGLYKALRLEQVVRGAIVVSYDVACHAHEVFVTKATGRRDVVFEQNCEAGAYHIIQISLGSQDLERVGQYSCVCSGPCKTQFGPLVPKALAVMLQGGWKQLHGDIKAQALLKPAAVELAKKRGAEVAKRWKAQPNVTLPAKHRALRLDPEESSLPAAASRTSLDLTDSGDCEAQGPASIIPEQDDYESEEYFSDDHNGREIQLIIYIEAGIEPTLRWVRVKREKRFKIVSFPIARIFNLVTDDGSTPTKFLILTGHGMYLLYRRELLKESDCTGIEEWKEKVDADSHLEELALERRARPSRAGPSSSSASNSPLQGSAEKRGIKRKRSPSSSDLKGKKKESAVDLNWRF
ncbi:hypothetical protein C8J57DRAFT_1528787 [Mycena rebaudengoi]|nr:hypothetical protein C8J57DRAFT_1528787 [Mycena rebaudengoi]